MQSDHTQHRVSTRQLPVIAWLVTAIMAGAIAHSAPAAAGSLRLQADGGVSEGTPPPRLAVTLADGERVAGVLEAYDVESVTIGDRRVEWDRLAPDEAFRAMRQIIDSRDATHWLLVAEAMLSRPDGAGENLIELAIREATRLDGEIGPQIGPMQERARERRERLLIDRSRNEVDGLRRGLPEGEFRTADPWPAIPPESREDVALEVRARAERMLEGVGLRVEPVDSDVLLVYGDLPREELARWTVQLETTLRETAAVLGIAAPERLFNGRAVVFLHADRERFRLMAAQAFDQFVHEGALGYCHGVGPDVFINMHRDPDVARFGTELTRQLVFGILHRHVSARRLPAWANEGFASAMAERTFDASTVNETSRRIGLRFVRGGGRIESVMGLGYDEIDAWGELGTGRGVGFLMVERMLKQRPEPFARWVRAIKLDKEWQQALVDQYGVAPVPLAREAEAWFRFNDG